MRPVLAVTLAQIPLGIALGMGFHIDPIAYVIGGVSVTLGFVVYAWSQSAKAGRNGDEEWKALIHKNMMNNLRRRGDHD